MNTMPISIDEGKEIIIDAIENKTTHSNYKRTTNLATLYATIITGEGIPSLLKQFELRETDEAFEQRLALTISTVDALCKSVMNPFEKVLRTEPLVKRIESSDEGDIAILTDKIMTFYSSENQNSGLDYWLQTRFKSLSFLDPNSFVALEWDNFDENKERASPYPYEIPAQQAINFYHRNNKLEWLLDKKPIQFISSDTKKNKQDGFKYTLYAIGFVVVFERVGDKYELQSGEELWIGKGGSKYVIRIHTTLLRDVPIFSIGYIGDDRTKQETYVNPFHASISWFKKIINLESESDLSKTLHAFPQKFQYVQRCSGSIEIPCRDGRDLDGNRCKVCNGTGTIVHTSSQDAVYLPLPKDKDNFLDLDQLMVYKYPPIDLLRFQEEILDKFEQKIHASVFNTLSLIKKTTVATATERDLDMDNVYDTLHPFAEKITSLWSGIAQMVADITETGSADLVIDHRYPNDFKLKTLSHLLDDLKAVNDSNGPSFIRSKISEDIIEQTFVDQPEEFSKYQVRKQFYPFPGKTESEIDTLLTLDLIELRTKILYANFDILFRNAEKRNIGFWQMSFEQQELIIDKLLDELERTIKPKTISFNSLS